MSSSSSSSSTNSSTYLASLYECPVCFDYISPPIFQCSNGHMVCSSCSPNLNHCHSCRGPLSISRNLALEKALSVVHFPCKFSAKGYQVNMLLTDKTAHEKNCPLQPTCCPFHLIHCYWQGPIGQIVHHFLSEHGMTDCVTKGENLLFEFDEPPLSNYPPTEYAEYAKLLECHGHHFLFILQRDRNQSDDGPKDRLFVAVLLIGVKSEAQNFSYSVKLSGHRHQLKWKATTLSINDDLDSASKTNGCLLIESTDLFKKFIKNDKLVFNVKVERFLAEVDTEFACAVRSLY